LGQGGVEGGTKVLVKFWTKVTVSSLMDSLMGARGKGKGSKNMLLIE
jgi:hypothetical protein